jgi:hypothetical protein
MVVVMAVLPIKLANDDAVISLSRIVVIDLEASASYPTAIGWCLPHDDGTVTSGACLILPAAKWTT